MNEVKENKRTLVTTQIDVPLQNTKNDRKMHSLMLPFVTAKGNILLKSMNKCIKRIIPSDANTRITYTGRKLNTRFQIKYKLPKFINMNRFIMSRSVMQPGLLRQNYS